MIFFLFWIEPGWWASLGRFSRFQLKWWHYFKELLNLWPVGKNVTTPSTKIQCFVTFYLTSFRRRIFVFKRGSRNPSDCILLFWNTTNTSFHMSLAREECVMLVLLLEVVYGLAHDVKLKRFFQSLKNEKPRKLLSYDIPFMATPSFGYHVPFQLL